MQRYATVMEDMLERYGQPSGVNAEGASRVPAGHIKETILAAKGRLALVVDMGAPDAVAIEGQYLADFLRQVDSEPGTEAPETDLIGHLAQLCADNRPDPLSELEKAVARSLGIGNAPEVWGAMAALEQIWVLRDREGNLVSLQPYIDLFTSSAHAEAFVLVYQTQLFQRLAEATPRIVVACHPDELAGSLKLSLFLELGDAQLRDTIWIAQVLTSNHSVGSLTLSGSTMNIAPRAALESRGGLFHPTTEEVRRFLGAQSPCDKASWIQSVGTRALSPRQFSTMAS